jgi:general L-amino acid transport system substrate-binding protein
LSATDCRPSSLVSRLKGALVCGALGVLIAVGPLAAAVAGPTLQAVRERGSVRCGIVERPGLAARDLDGRWRGFEVDLCRAVASAVLRDPDTAEFVALTFAQRLDALAAGDLDVLFGQTTWTLTRDADVPIDFAGIELYDGQGFLGGREFEGRHIADVRDATVCVVTGTTTELNLDELIRTVNPRLKTLPVQTFEARNAAWASHRCDLVTDDRIALAIARAFETDRPSEYAILPDVISREPLGPAVRNDDPEWFAIVRWTLLALVVAEAKGVTAASLPGTQDETDPEVRRLLGIDPGLGAALGLDERWAFRAIQFVGNYGEIFERHLGRDSQVKLPRGLNALWTQGGLLYPPPFR